MALKTGAGQLGLAAVKFWSRKEFKGCNTLKRSINPTRVPIEQKESFRWLENLRQSTALFAEPQRCVHIGDRESDIYELFSRFIAHRHLRRRAQCSVSSRADQVEAHDCQFAPSMKPRRS